MAAPRGRSMAVRGLSAAVVVAEGHPATAEIKPTQVWSILEISEMTVTGDAYLAPDVEGNTTGSSSCNRFQMSVTKSVTVLRYDQIAATRFVCPPDADRQERALFSRFSRSRSVSNHILHNQITLTAPNRTHLILQRSE